LLYEFVGFFRLHTLVVRKRKSLHELLKFFSKKLKICENAREYGLKSFQKKVGIKLETAGIFILKLEKIK